ncbi:hypothetical protein DFQ04_3191 [Algoriphagus boseongensis]|uniref:Uncharacterized protein n=1 Tax=Algoriphagus boseongensis TaxID=1442587 RepID=A0A4R6T0P0_9BACT|nr:hypothetical protein [Algoriphagus boseongensis]TDQ14603.1 hypothetical protein DFQ04_3191 [Algoriphagus boseongensis]
MKIDKDPELKAFFQEIRKQDEQLLIPPFPELEKKSHIQWWIPMGIAASLALGAFFFTSEEKQEQPSPEVLIITLEEGPDQELQFHIQETTEMDIWESPTASLLTEF